MSDLTKSGLFEDNKMIRLSWVSLGGGIDKATIRMNGVFEMEVVCNEETINIETECTRTGFDGYRRWLLCPGCGKRRSELYFTDTIFLCRQCLSLVYKGQHETKVDQLRRKVRKIRAKLGGSDNLLEPIVGRPKYMHHCTFNKLVQEERLLKAKILNELSGYIRS